jgi:TetR/AcrR family tetracycline transcriptional repressor
METDQRQWKAGDASSNNLRAIRQDDPMARLRRTVLTRAIVVDAAIKMIGEGGLESFSMPKLGKALGVSAPSLYHHFSDKDALLAEVARTVATPEAPSALPAEAHWTDYLVTQSVALRRSIVAHPHCAPLLVRFMPRENMFEEYEQMCRFLLASGVPPRDHIRIVDGMTALTIGAAFLNENAAHYTESGQGPKPNQDAHPNLCAALETIGEASPDEQFESYLRTYLQAVLPETEERPSA